MFIRGSINIRVVCASWRCFALLYDSALDGVFVGRDTLQISRCIHIFSRKNLQTSVILFLLLFFCC